MKVKHYIVKETGDPAVDQIDVVDRGYGDLWIEFSEYLHRSMLTARTLCQCAPLRGLEECIWLAASHGANLFT